MESNKSLINESVAKKLVEQNFDWENNTWNVVDTFFKQDNVFIQHHIHSFDHFLAYELENIVHEKEFQLKVHNKASYDESRDMYGETYVVEFGKVSIAKPVLQDDSYKPMFPSEARIRKLTYSSSLYVDIHHKTLKTNFDNGKVEEIRHPDILSFSLGKMPIMVGSKFCVLSQQSNMTKVEMGEGEYDLGGYFIVKGSEKVIVNQERKCENRVYCFKQKEGGKLLGEVSMKSIHPEMPNYISAIYIKMKAKEETLGGHVLRFHVKKLRQDIPVIVVFRALGYESDKAITELVVYDVNAESNIPIIDMLRASIEEAKQIQTQQEALEYISKYLMGLPVNKMKDTKCRLRYTYELLCNELFPHVGMDPIKKAYFLGYMINKMFKCHLGILPYDDRDSYMNKRIETSGELMGQLFRAYFGRFFKELKGACEKEMIQQNDISELPKNLSNKLKPNDIESGIKFALSTGNWGLKSSAQMRKGVAQVLQRVSYLGTMSNLRRIVSDLDKNVKQTEPRQLHNTQYGLICPFETPEGANIGIIKNMSLMAYITVPSDPTVVINCLDELGVKGLSSLKPYDVGNSVKVFVNGDWYGQTFNPYDLTMRLRAMRRNGAINIYTSIAWHIHKNEIQIWTDAGRLCRPLYVVKNNKINIDDNYVEEMKSKNHTWKDLLTRPIQYQENKEGCGCGDYKDDKAIIEYLDVEEIDTCMVAMTIHNLEMNHRENDSFYNYTHCEIHPSMMLGVLTANIPYPEHNPAPRNMFQAAQCKQAMGIYTTSFKKRMDTLSYILHYPQKSVVNTMNSKYLHSEDIPAGQMAIVAIACYMGYNQEDSLIFNQSSIERGLYSSSIYKTYVDEEKKNLTTLEEEKFCKPEKFYANGKLKTKKMSFGSYDKLDADGFIKVGSKVEGNDIIIGKVVPIKDAKEGDPKFTDASTPLAETESGIVDMVYKNRNGDGYMFSKVRIKSDRDPELGDKFCCYDKDTEILTKNKGWIMIKDLNKDDLVATLVNGNELIYEKPSDVMSYDFDGNMYNIKSNQVELMVTPNHRMWVGDIKGNNYKIKRADELYGKRVKYQKNIDVYETNIDNEFFTLPSYENFPEKKLDMKSFLTIFGIWIAEGWLSYNSITFATHKERVKNALTEACNKLGYTLVKRKEDKDDEIYNRWYISDKQLAQIFKPISGGAIHKYLPDWVWELNRENSEYLMESMILGDGHYMENGTERYDTSSSVLANDFQRLCFHAGYSANLYLKYSAGKESYCESRDEIFKSQHDAYRLTVIKKQNKPIVNKNITKDGENRNDSWVYYNDKVYCCSVTSGIIYVRKNGIPVWSGNSRH